MSAPVITGRWRDEERKEEDRPIPPSSVLRIPSHRASLGALSDDDDGAAAAARPRRASFVSFAVEDGEDGAGGEDGVNRESQRGGFPGRSRRRSSYLSSDGDDRQPSPRNAAPRAPPDRRLDWQNCAMAQRQRQRRRSSRFSEGSKASATGGGGGGGSRRAKSRRRSSFLSILTDDGPDDSRDGEGYNSSDRTHASRAEKSIIWSDRKVRAVFCLRSLMISTLVIATVVCSALTYRYISRGEFDNFQTQYRDAVVKVAEAFQHGIDVKTSAASTFSSMYTSRYGWDDAWPNVTMPDFERQAAGQLRLARGRALSFNPVVKDDRRESWEQFAAGSKGDLGAEPSKVEHVNDGIFGKVPPAAGSRYPNTSVPVWQIAPIAANEGAVMFNLHSERDRMRALDNLMAHGVPTLTAIIQLVQDEEQRPSSILFYPVFDRFDDEKSVGVGAAGAHGNGTTWGAGAVRKVVGTVSIVFSWDAVLESVLPNYIRGLTVVLDDSSMGQKYTFTITGDVATFLGEGDLHDPNFDHMRHEVHANLQDTSEILGDVDYLITYRLSIYPSAEMQAQYVTNRPVLYTLGVVLIFVCTSGLFLLYDYLVEHRQNRLMRAAIRSSHIVDSLFPDVVRDRLFRNAEETMSVRSLKEYKKTHPARKNRPRRRISLTQGANHSITRMKQFLGGSSENVKRSTEFDVPAGIKSGAPSSAPIADLFQNTSIMFCDIVGFTAWSSAHEPNDVFLLLESLFWEFDQLAKEYGVFKLGTIGDCYIAVTGLPDPCEDHALVLAKFTEECRRKMHEVNAFLTSEMGLETSGLSMRFGIHSGPVTAGVLRGKKSRFELFGDTINTASRMESTGSPNRIQISQETADEIERYGRASWLVRREELVKAKGKGDLQTYWLRVRLDGDPENGWFGDDARTSETLNDMASSRHHYYADEEAPSDATPSSNVAVESNDGIATNIAVGATGAGSVLIHTASSRGLMRRLSDRGGLKTSSAMTATVNKEVKCDDTTLTVVERDTGRGNHSAQRSFSPCPDIEAGLASDNTLPCTEDLSAESKRNMLGSNGENRKPSLRDEMKRQNSFPKASIDPQISLCTHQLESMHPA